MGLLESGSTITLTGMLFVILGRRTQTPTRPVYINEGARLTTPGTGIANRIFTFSTDDESTIRVKVTYLEGRCSYSIFQIPGPIGTTSFPHYEEWHFPKIKEGEVVKKEEITVGAQKGVFGFRLVNENPAASNITFHLEVAEKKWRFPRFYGIGTQILVVGIPLIIASFFS